MSGKIRQRIRFTGRVQGVGFRYTAQCAARLNALTGWVHNEDDGSVLMEIQGEKTSIDKMIGQIDSGTFIIIDTIEKTPLPPRRAGTHFPRTVAEKKCPHTIFVVCLSCDK